MNRLAFNILIVALPGMLWGYLAAGHDFRPVNLIYLSGLIGGIVIGVRRELKRGTRSDWVRIK